MECLCIKLLNAYWLRYQGDYENYTCINDVMFWFIQNVLGVITDIIIVLLPCRLVASLYLGKRQKQALYGIFGLGFMYVQFANTPLLENQELTKHNTAYVSLESSGSYSPSMLIFILKIPRVSYTICVANFRFSMIRISDNSFKG